MGIMWKLYILLASSCAGLFITMNLAVGTIPQYASFLIMLVSIPCFSLLLRIELDLRATAKALGSNNQRKTTEQYWFAFSLLWCIPIVVLAIPLLGGGLEFAFYFVCISSGFMIFGLYLEQIATRIANIARRLNAADHNGLVNDSGEIRSLKNLPNFSELGPGDKP